MCENGCENFATIAYEGEALCADCAVGYELAILRAAEEIGERRAREWARAGRPISRGGGGGGPSPSLPGYRLGRIA